MYSINKTVLQCRLGNSMNIINKKRFYFIASFVLLNLQPKKIVSMCVFL